MNAETDWNFELKNQLWQNGISIIIIPNHHVVKEKLHSEIYKNFTGAL